MQEAGAVALPGSCLSMPIIISSLCLYKNLSDSQGLNWPQAEAGPWVWSSASFFPLLLLVGVLM